MERDLTPDSITHEDHHHPEYCAQRWEHGYSRDELRPPSALNVVLALLIMSLGWGAMVWATRLGSWWATLALGVFFGLLYLPLYTLMHEAMHRIFHTHRGVNDAFGWLMMAHMPGSFTLFRHGHNMHHRLNRTDAELFDAYYPGESATLKRLAFYGYYLGGFWLIVFLSNAVVLLAPWLMRSKILQQSRAAGPKIESPQRHMRRIRVEALGVVLLHVLMVWALDISAWAYVACYGAFAFSWSSQNFITHAHAPRHILNGAYNLKASAFYQLWLLHFNWHLAHHQHPSIPWIHLPKIHDQRRARPGYLATWLRFWRGPRPVTDPAPVSLARIKAQEPAPRVAQLDDDLQSEVVWSS